MKKWISMIFFCFLHTSPLIAAKLIIDVSPNFKKYDYLCIEDIGCFNLALANDKTFNVGPVDFTKLKRMVIVNFATHLISNTKVNSSCKQIKTNDHETILIQVELHEADHARATVIKSINCSLQDD